MKPKHYFETSYEDIITTEGLTKLSDFIEVPFNYELMSVKVNMSQYI